MSGLAVLAEVGVLETRQERARRRTDVLRTSTQTIFETLALIYRDEDWRYVNDAAGHPYSGFTAYVCDQLDCSASNARRIQQGIVGLVLPLQELTGAGSRIPVTSSDVARLGVAGARVVIEEAPAALQGVEDAGAQAAALRELIDSVAARACAPGFGPLTTSAAAGTSIGALVPAELPARSAVAEPTAGGGAAGGETLSDGDERPGRRPAPAHPEGRGVEVSDPDRAAPVAGSVIDFGIGDGGDERPAGGAAAAGLEAAIAAILDGDDPVALAQRIPRSAGPRMAADCAAAAQRLARLGQLLRSLNT